LRLEIDAAKRFREKVLKLGFTALETGGVEVAHNSIILPRPALIADRPFQIGLRNADDRICRLLLRRS